MASKSLKLPKKGTWGGARPGAGRKPGPNPKVLHHPRPEHDARYPVLVTFLRAPKGVPSFRSPKLLRLLREVVADTVASDLEGFRIVLFGIAPTQLDFVVEADDRDSLSRALRSLSIRLALRINASIERNGKVFPDRYRARVLGASRDVRDVLDRVLAGTREKAQAPRTALLRKEI